jgi:hypothetical protein
MRIREMCTTFKLKKHLNNLTVGVKILFIYTEWQKNLLTLEVTS